MRRLLRVPLRLQPGQSDGRTSPRAFWHTHTGYFPVNNKTLELPVEKEYLKKNPIFEVAIKSFNKTKIAPATTGCVAGSMPQIRKASEDGSTAALKRHGQRRHHENPEGPGGHNR